MYPQLLLPVSAVGFKRNVPNKTYFTGSYGGDDIRQMQEKCHKEGSRLSCLIYAI